MGLRERLRRLEREAERAPPTSEQYLAAARRETARRLRGAYERLVRIPGNGQFAPRPGPVRDFLVDDTPERSDADRRVVEKWERANGKADTQSGRTRRGQGR